MPLTQIPFAFWRWCPYSKSVDRLRSIRTWLRQTGPRAAWPALLLITGCASWPAHQQHQLNARFEFALLGDVPYSDEDATNHFPNVIRELNHSRLAFVVHCGDIKSGSTPCTDDLFAQRRTLFQSILHPFILIPGDNEWSDCGKAKRELGYPPEVYDPTNRLDRLRELFASGQRSLGQRTLLLERQSQDSRFADFRENVRWSYGHILFVGLNVPGNANNYGQPEFEHRNQANLAFLQESFRLAQQQNRRAVMIVIQANPHYDKRPSDPLRAGFNDFLQTLERETIAFEKPVVLVHGDSHYFRIDKPMVGSKSGRRVENFTRVETFGNPDVHWIRARVDGRDPDVFSFRQQLVPANKIDHR